jgi:hypothetical protein
MYFLNRYDVFVSNILAAGRNPLVVAVSIPLEVVMRIPFVVRADTVASTLATGA